MKEQILKALPLDHPWREQIIWFDIADSTNNRAKSLLHVGLPHGTVVMADAQTGGRGRMGRSFQSPAGMGIYMSVILRPQCTPDRLMHLTCAVAVAMCDAVEEVTGLRPDIKWTNDLVLSSRKVGGILTELVTTPAGTSAVIGVGINCLQQVNDFEPQLQSFAGSLAMALEAPVDRAKLAAAMICALEKMDKALLTEKEETMNRYREGCITLNKDISILQGDQVRHGFAFGLDDDGALLVSFADGHKETVNSGEVSVRGMYGYI